MVASALCVSSSDEWLYHRASAQCVCDRLLFYCKCTGFTLLFYSKCTGVTVRFTYGDISLCMSINQY